ncbi:MAG TPA: antibiotic biosynthesis monooxygenase [Candidatus Acidoferrum sp.]|jgi:heme-degrading monooxygenase HmoA
MIARVWTARAEKTNLKKYLKYFSANVLPKLKTFDGFSSVMLLRREIDDEEEIVVYSFWRSEKAIEAFAGKDSQVAVVEPEALNLLKTYDKRVAHYKVDVADSSETISIFAGRE